MTHAWESTIVANLSYEYIVGAALGGSAGVLLAAVLFYIYFQIRRAPKELLQLRLFQSAEVLSRSLLAMGIGLAGGVFLILPIILSVSIPGLVYVAIGLPFFLLFIYGILGLVRVFRLPAGAPR